MARLTSKKKDPEGFIRKGKKLLREGMYRQAIDEFKKGLSQAPTHNELHYLVGLAHLKAGDEKEAETRFRRTLEANPHHVEAREELSRILEKRRKEDPSPQKAPFETMGEGHVPRFEGREWGDVREKYQRLFSEVRKKEGEQSFVSHMLWQEFVFRLERRKEDAPSFFFFTERHRFELIGDVFDLILRYASHITTPARKKERETLLEQADWIARNLGGETHIAKVERIFWR